MTKVMEESSGVGNQKQPIAVSSGTLFIVVPPFFAGFPLSPVS